VNEELKAQLKSLRPVKTQYKVILEYKNGTIETGGSATSDREDHENTVEHYRNRSDYQLNRPSDYDNPIVKVHALTRTVKTSDWGLMP
jgi:hypothetical protein